MRKILIGFVLVLSLLLVNSAYSMTLAWDIYTDSNATGLKIESSIDQSVWATVVDNIPTTNVASEIPDNTTDDQRVYYRMKGFNATLESGPSNVVSYFWTTGGGGHSGPAPVGGVKLLDCDEILLDDQHPNYNTCLNRNIPW